MTADKIPSLLHDLVRHAERIRDVHAPAGTRVRTDRDVQDMILWNFIVIGEVCARLGDVFRNQHPEIPWSAVIGHRHIIAHGYDVLDWNRLIEVIEKDVPILIEQARKLLQSYGPPPQV